MEIGRTEKIGLSHHRIYTEIASDASPDTVWTVLTEAERRANAG